jgi:hypothetical protein
MKRSFQIVFLLGMVKVLCVTTTFVFAQGPDTLWTKTYGGIDDDRGYSVQQTIDGGYVIAGRTTSFGAGGIDVYLIKTDSLGDTLWTKTFGGVSSDIARSVQQTSDCGYIIAGGTMSFGAGSWDVWLLKTDANGDTLWTWTYGSTGGDYGESAQETIDGGYIIVGSKWTSGTDCDLLLAKLNENGDTLWTKTYSGSNYACGCAVQQTSDSGYIVAGVISHNVWLIKTDENGNIIWQKTYSGDTEQYPIDVQQTTDSGYIVVGVIGGWPRDGYVIKTDSCGDTLWTKRLIGEGHEGVASVQEIYDGCYIIAGWTESYGVGNRDFYVIKMNEDGDTLWTKTYGGTDYDCGHSIQVTSDDGYIIAGVTYSFGAGGADVYLIKTIPDTLGIEENQITNHQMSFLEILPNPFSDKIDIWFQITDNSNATMEIFDVTGRLVKNFNLKSEISNLQSIVSWNGTDDSNRKLSSGVYFVKFTAEDHSATEKLLLIR